MQLRIAAHFSVCLSLKLRMNLAKFLEEFLIIPNRQSISVSKLSSLACFPLLLRKEAIMPRFVNILLQADVFKHKIQILTEEGKIIKLADLLSTVVAKYPKLVEYFSNQNYQLEIFDEDFNEYVSLNECDEIHDLSRLRAVNKNELKKDETPSEKPEVKPTTKGKTKQMINDEEAIKENVQSNCDAKSTVGGGIVGRYEASNIDNATISETQQNQLVFLSCVKDTLSKHANLKGKDFWKQVRALIEQRGYVVIKPKQLPKYLESFVDVYVKISQEFSSTKAASTTWPVFDIIHNLNLQGILPNRKDYVIARNKLNKACTTSKNANVKKNPRKRKRKRKSKTN